MQGIPFGQGQTGRQGQALFGQGTSPADGTEDGCGGDSRMRVIGE
ncbi:hypothetical protein [Thermoactinomyces sp. CICC 10521]|nr:hypothetical protein [Thermoactinomyces sp. CICC 10521]